MYVEPVENTRYPEFPTSNRDLENYLFAQGIHWHRQYRAADCMTYWVYRETPEFMKALTEYKEHRAERIEAKRRKANEV